VSTNAVPSARVESSAPTTPPTVARAPGEVELLLSYVRERDVPCPRCGYNLRNLTTPVCPECRENLRLCVGVQRVRYEWLIATLAPGIFSGIAAMLLLIPIAIESFRGVGAVPWQPIVIDLTGWLSAACAIGLFVSRERFLRLPIASQKAWAAIAWALHIAAFLAMILMLM
jgi:hypothetical protein